MHLLLFTVIGALMVMVSAHPTGGDIKSCGNLEPQHHEDKDDSKPHHKTQTGPSPYSITFQPESVAPGEVVQVKIEGDVFKGFMIQGKDYNTGEIVGAFTSGEK
ncbi:reeler domain-containing protein, partial [Pseudoalteromonas sp. BMB]|uniref:reeler domain-containing protein n=1 Tax=Pseudoalteromonas sp. BMB TaxID=1874619 RepID=UPI001112ED3E